MDPHRALRPTVIIPRTFDVRPDTADFRDRIYEPTLVEVPPEIPLEAHRGRYPDGKLTILDQGSAGACTGYGLAAVAHFLLRTRRLKPDSTPVSPHMLYAMARRHDEWADPRHGGSSARGAMKGWHKHGICAEALWPGPAPGRMTRRRTEDGARRPLGAYFRVDHRDLSAIHAALAEAGILFATALVHGGWLRTGPDGSIFPGRGGPSAHAFAIVGYEARGFWIQNSWDIGWARGGFGLLAYDDWLLNGLDVWAARLGAPVVRSFASRHRVPLLSFPRPSTVPASDGAGAASGPADLRPFVIHLGRGGLLHGGNGGRGDDGGTAPADLRRIFSEEIPRRTRDWPRRRILFYAHGGLVDRAEALGTAERLLPAFLKARIYPVFFIWGTGFLATLTGLIADLLHARTPEDGLGPARGILQDRLNATVEILARAAGLDRLWKSMRHNALQATADRAGGVRLALKELSRLLENDPAIEVHAAAHSAGAILLAPLIRKLATRGGIRAGLLRGEKGLGRRLASLTLWAPACTLALFREALLPLLRNGGIGRFALFTLKERFEREDRVAGIYGGSVLELVSRALEDGAGSRAQAGVPLLGLERCLLDAPGLTGARRRIAREDPAWLRIPGLRRAFWIRAPNRSPASSPCRSHARRHDGFDDDPATVRSTLLGIDYLPQPSSSGVGS